MTIQATPRLPTLRTGHTDDNCPEDARRPSKPDRRVERTKRALIAALIQCMIEKGYEESSVADIVQRADVGRSTFYAHYADKEDLLKESIEGLMAHLRQAAVTTSARSAAAHPALGFVRPMLEHVQEMHVLFRALANKPSGAAVQRQIHLALTEYVQQDLAEQRVALQGPAALVAEFVVGAFLSVCFWWMSRDQPGSVAEIERTFASLLAPALERA